MLAHKARTEAEQYVRFNLRVRQQRTQRRVGAVQVVAFHVVIPGVGIGDDDGAGEQVHAIRPVMNPELHGIELTPRVGPVARADDTLTAERQNLAAGLHIPPLIFVTDVDVSLTQVQRVSRGGRCVRNPGTARVL